MSKRASTVSRQEWMLAWVSLIHAGTYLASVLDGHLRQELAISLAEQDLLKQLGSAGGEIKLSELARRLHFSKAGMTKMTDRLESEGLLERVRPGDDRRVVSARLTPKGRRTLKRSRELLGAFVAEHFRAHLTDRQIRGLGSALQALLEGHGRWEGQLRHLRGEPHDDTTGG